MTRLFASVVACRRSAYLNYLADNLGAYYGPHPNRKPNVRLLSRWRESKEFGISFSRVYVR